MAFDMTDFMTFMAIIMDPTQPTGIPRTPMEDPARNNFDSLSDSKLQRCGFDDLYSTKHMWQKWIGNTH